MESRAHTSIARKAFVTGGLLASLIVAGFVFLEYKFPLRRDAVIHALEQQTGARVEIGSFETRWFPPRFTARSVKLTRSDGIVLDVGWAAISATYTGLLRTPRRLHDVEATDVHLSMPARRLTSLRMTRGNGAGIAVAYLHITKAGLDFTSDTPEEKDTPEQKDTPEKKPLQFVIHSLAVRGLAPGQRADFKIALHNPKPSGEIRSAGSFGPFDHSDALATPVSGSFTFEHADISIRHAIAGTLGATGTYGGPLRAIACKGTADVPFFQVFGSSNAVHLASQFDVTVNARNGDVALNRVVSHFNDSTITASGTIARETALRGKIARIAVDVPRGTVQDLLLLFTQHRTPAMKGLIDLTAKFTIPPGPPDFLTRLGVQGSFHIRDAYFTNPRTQVAIDRLTASARGNPKLPKREAPPLERAEIEGHASDNSTGTVRLTDIGFSVPGTTGEMDGVFGLHRKDLRFRGEFDTEGKMSDTSYGIKSILLKAITPIWHKHEGRRSVPFVIGGTASRPRFRLRM